MKSPQVHRLPTHHACPSAPERSTFAATVDAHFRSVRTRESTTLSIHATEGQVRHRRTCARHRAHNASLFTLIQLNSQTRKRGPQARAEVASARDVTPASVCCLLAAPPSRSDCGVAQLSVGGICRQAGIATRCCRLRARKMSKLSAARAILRETRRARASARALP